MHDGVDRYTVCTASVPACSGCPSNGFVCRSERSAADTRTRSLSSAAFICEGILLHRNFASFYMWFWAKIKPCRQYRAYTVSKSHSRKKYKYITNKCLVQPLKKGYTNTAVRSFPLCRWSSHLRRCKRIAVLLHCRFLFSDRIIAYIAHLFNGHSPQI